ncbi:MAG: PGF-pre-PGF domain-containing protein [Candidatus Aenigmatarchaeota archaeon]
MKKIFATFAVIFVFIALSAPIAFAASLSISIGDYETSVYVNTDFTVPVTVTSDNVTGNVQVTIAPKSGLTCKQPSTCTNTLSFTTSGSKDTSFILTASMTGTYTNPFTISASSLNVTATPVTGSSTIAVTEQPSWTISFTSNNLTTRQVTAGQTIILDLNIAVTNTIYGVRANLSLPSGWSLTAGNLSYDLGNITATKSAQWSVSADNPEEDQLITLLITSTNPPKSSSKAINVGTNPSGSLTSTTTTTTTTTTTLAGEATTTTTVSPSAARVVHRHIHSWNTIRPGVQNIIRITKREIGFKQISIDVKNPVNNVRITITKLEGRPAHVVHEIRGRVYKYVEVNAENLADNDVSSAKIEFEVEKVWINSNNIDKSTIALNRYHIDGWERLRTRIINETDTYIIYEAESPGFSVFAITGETIEVTTTTTLVIPTTTMPITPTTIPVATTIHVTTTLPPKEMADYTWILFVITLLIAVCILVFFGLKKSK